MTSVTYTDARARLAKVWEEVEDSQEPVLVTRKGHQTMALLPADELSALMTTAHLLRSPKNRDRLLSALTRSVEEVGVPVNLKALRATLLPGTAAAR